MSTESDLMLVAGCNAALETGAVLEKDGLDLHLTDVPKAWWAGEPGVLHAAAMAYRATGSGRVAATLVWLHTRADDCIGIVAWRGGAHLVYAPTASGTPEEHAVGRRAGSPRVRKVIAYAEAVLDQIIREPIEPPSPSKGQEPADV